MANEPTAETGAGKAAERALELSPRALAREKAGKVVRPMLVDITQKLTEETGEAPASDGLKALALYTDIITLAPFKPRDEGPIPLNEGNPILMPEFKVGSETFKAGEGRIIGISRLDDDPQNGRLYSVIVETPAGARETAISDVVLADAQLASDGDNILAAIPQEMSQERDFLQAYLPLLDQRHKAGDPDPTPIAADVLTAMVDKYPESSIVPDAPGESTSSEAPQEESMAAQYQRANAEIARQITFLEKKIEGLKGEEKRKAQDLLLAMKIAREHNGIFAVFEKADVLDAAKMAATEPRERAHIEAAGKRLAPLIEQADTELTEWLQQQGLSDETLTEIAKIASDPDQGIAKIFERPELLALPDIEDNINGSGFDQARLDQIIDESHLTAEQKTYLKKAGKGAFWVFIAALGLPVVAALGSFALATSVMAKQ